MKKVFRFILPLFLFSFAARAGDPLTCQNYFQQWITAADHPGLHNSAFGLEPSKIASVFVVQKDGLPYYPPQWNLGVFAHSYPPVTLREGGLSPAAGSLGGFKKGDLLVLVGVEQNDQEARFNFLSHKKFSIKPDDPKETDRVSLQLIVPKEGDGCLVQKRMEDWLKGFWGMLEAEIYVRGGFPAPPPAFVAEDSPKKKSKKEEIQATAEEPPSYKAKEVSAVATQEFDFHSGMPRPDVDGLLGAPKQVVKLGDKSICRYDDVVIEFVNDKLTQIRLSETPSPEVLKRFH